MNVLGVKNRIRNFLSKSTVLLTVSLLLCLIGNPCSNVYGANDTSNIPEFMGDPVVVLNGNIPTYTEKQKIKTNSFENYTRLDSLGRCGTAYANIGRDLMPTTERGEIGQVRPSGWQTIKYSEIIEGNYLYNRCHLIGYQLAGENANTKNLITGTRFMNVDGMLPYENTVASYVRRTGNHVLYRVTPVYEGNDLVARGVTMEAWSVEDKGKGVCFNVFCYNAQPGIEIDYSNGRSKVDPEYVIPATSKYESVKSAGGAFKTSQAKAEASQTVQSEAVQTTQQEVTQTPQPEATQEVAAAAVAQVPAAGCDYIGNKNTRKFHYPNCSSVSDMAEHNKYNYIGGRDGIIAEGYIPCKRCNP